MKFNLLLASLVATAAKPSSCPSVMPLFKSSGDQAIDRQVKEAMAQLEQDCSPFVEQLPLVQNQRKPKPIVDQAVKEPTGRIPIDPPICSAPYMTSRKFYQEGSALWSSGPNCYKCDGSDKFSTTTQKCIGITVTVKTEFSALISASVGVQRTTCEGFTSSCDKRENNFICLMKSSEGTRNWGRVEETWCSESPNGFRGCKESCWVNVYNDVQYLNVQNEWYSCEGKGQICGN
jgi:hypothetical protein